MAAHRFGSENNLGRPAGSKNRNSLLRSTIIKAFEENEEKAKNLINGMFDNKSDFKWLCTLQASLEPKDPGIEVNVFTQVWNHSTEKASDVSADGRINPRSEVKVQP